jgi:hypothetical protein
VTFPGYVTLQHNIRTGYWNIARTFGQQDWKVIGSAGHLVDYYLTPNGIAVLEAGLNTDESVKMQRGGVSAPIWAGGDRISLREFYLDAEVGRAGINKPARVMMRVAPDGEVFRNELHRDLGKTGDYRRRAIWRNLGLGRNIAIELFVTDDVEFSIVNTSIKAVKAR